MTYRIENRHFATILGDYLAELELGAYVAMMADAGYRTEAEAQSAGYTLTEVSDDLSIYKID